MTEIKTWTRDEINAILHRNPLAVERALIILYERQTRDEQNVDTTKHWNAVGFSASAARRGSYYARWVKSGRRLTGIHLERARQIALSHSKQLVEVANS